MDVERGRTVKGWRPRRLGEHILLRLGSGSCRLLSHLSFLYPLLLSVFSSSASCSHALSLSSSAFLVTIFSPGLVSYSGLLVRSKSTDVEKPVWSRIPAYVIPGWWIFPSSCLIFLILESGNNGKSSVSSASQLASLASGLRSGL